MEWYDDQEIQRFTLELSDYDSMGLAWPRQFKVLTYQPKSELRLSFRELQVNPALAPAELMIPPPDKRKP